jgi:hypothetical protein
MAMDAHAGSFTIQTAANSLTTVTDPNFTPKAIVFWGTGRTEATDAIGRANVFTTFGWAASTTSRAVVGGFSEDAQGASDADRAANENACIVQMTAARAVDGLGDLHSFNTNGFTIMTDDDFSSGVRISYLALGGDSLTGVTAGRFQAPTSTGTAAVTGMAFQPDCVLLMNYGSTTDPPVTSPHLTMGVGAAASSTARFTVGVRSQNNQSNATTSHYIYSGECIHKIDPVTVAAAERADFDSFQADGFWLDWTEVNEATDTFYLALAGGNYTVGNLQTQTDSSLITESGFGYQPTGALLMSCFQSESAQDVPAGDNRLSIGAFSSATSRTAQAILDETGAADTEVTTAIEHDACYVSIAADSTIDGLMDVQTIGSDGFSLIMDNADPAQRFVGYIAFGPAAGGSTVQKELTDSFTFTGNPARGFWGDRSQRDSFTLREGGSAAVSIDIAVNDLTLPAFADLQVRDFIGDRLPTDSFVLTDSPQRDFVGDRTMSDSVTFTDAISRAAVLDRALSDSATFTDQIARDLVLTRLVAGIFSFTDSQLRDFVGDRSMSDSVTLTDSLVRAAVMDRTQADQFVLTDSITRDAVLDRILGESITLTGSLLRDGVFTRQLQDVFTFLDNLDSAVEVASEATVRTLQDVFTFLGNLDRDIVTDRNIADAFTFADGMLRTGTFTRDVGDSNILAENFLTDALLDRTLQESLAFAEQILTDTVLVRGLADTIGLSDQVVRDLILDRLLSDVFAFVDSITATVGEAPVTPTEFVHWRLYPWHKWALRIRRWKHGQPTTDYPVQH